MRTTVTLDPDVAALVQRQMRERGLTFKAALNEAIRAGLAGRHPASPVSTPTFPMGGPAVPLIKALTLAADLEDEETARRLALRK